MAKIGILGGTFNPVHYSHLMMAQKACDVYQLDRVDFMPTYLPPHKASDEVISAHHRLNMLKLAIEDNPHFGIEDIELRQQKKQYSYDTMRQLCQMHPEHDYYFIIGGDMAASLDTWYNIDKLKQLVQFIAVERVGYHYKRDDVLPLSLPQAELSSSYIREEIKANHSIRYLVPNQVWHYIEKEGLYRG